MNEIKCVTDYERELARIQTDVRTLQRQMGIEPKTLEQRYQQRLKRLELEQQTQTSRAKPSWMNNPPI